MINLIAFQQLGQLRVHFKWWFLFYLITLLMNYITFGQLNLIQISVLMVPYAFSFYLLERLLRHYKSNAFYTLIMVLSTLLYFLLLCGLIWVLVYIILPQLEIFLYDRAIPFQFNWFMGNMYRNFFPVLVGALAYRMFRAYQDEVAEKLRAEQALSTSLEKKLELVQENNRLKNTLLRNQLGSHLKRNVIHLLRHRLAQTPDVQQLVDGLMEMQRYDYIQLDPYSEGVLLENEVHYIRQLICLNRQVYPDAVPVEFVVKQPLLARLIPPFICSTLLENALKYGEQHDARYPIRMGLESGPEQLTIWATNKIRSSLSQQSVTHQPSTGIGLNNIRKQLELFCPNHYEFETSRSGPIFKVRLAIRYEK